ncbi:HdeD family acid-resistance protein [Bdellovibrio bacteriovorus]|uniref:HdeD family acid-resistance protein n=1 Tax=Bdellovibrio bacteriovorus TaxID=959 RepID=UPI0035A70734
MIFASASTLASVMTLGAVLFVAGIAQIVYGIQGRKTGQLWPHVALGCLALACSVLIFVNPVANTMGLTLMIGFLLLASGCAKVIGAFVERSSGWGYYALNGAISILLAAMILYTFPASALWTIGTFVGVDLILGGATLIGLGSAMRKMGQDLVSAVNSLLPESHEEVEYRHYTRNGDRHGDLNRSEKKEDYREPPSLH